MVVHVVPATIARGVAEGTGSAPGLGLGAPPVITGSQRH